jgi:predicted lysophospholipase L1 biosynthesis ABC-type transport system permease subunit
MLQVFGAAKKLILRMLVLEFALLGIFSGTVGALLALILAYNLDAYFNINYTMHYKWVVIGLTLGLILFVPLGLIATRKVFQTSGLMILRQENI